MGAGEASLLIGEAGVRSLFGPVVLAHWAFYIQELVPVGPKLDFWIKLK